MGTQLVLDAPGRLRYEEYPEPDLGPGHVRLRTLFSGVSAGTELAQYRGTTPHAKRAWDPQRRLFSQAEVGLRYPVRDWGYEQVGEITEVGGTIPGLRRGDILWGSWGHRSTHLLGADQASRQRMPDGLEPVCGIFARIGAIALNGMLDAQVNVGETAVIFGAGVVGLILMQLAKLAGASVIAVDRLPARLDAAKRSGADAALLADALDVAAEVRRMTGDRGADVCIEATGAPAALHEAIRAAGYSATVVALGFFQGDAQDLRLGEEFHHNRITIVSSQISGVTPRLAHRWNRQRLEETVMAFQQNGRLRLRDLITDVVPFSRASEAFERLDRRPDQVLQMVLQF
ncbi:MAG TPA: zinc-binding alcohol dehydrogenase [bacterium]|nr:zinc-binding alcohol dehydrogenase [bacterium]